MRPVAIALGVLASIATILTYLHLDPPWVSKYLPHLAMPQGEAPATSGGTPPASFSDRYAAGYNASRHHDFSMAIEYYKAAVAAPDATVQERARAYDALGYAYFRIEDYDDADRALASALNLDPALLTPRVNQVKVICGRGKPSSDVLAAVNALRAAEAGSARAAHEIERDRELFAKCSYAGISPLN